MFDQFNVHWWFELLFGVNAVRTTHKIWWIQIYCTGINCGLNEWINEYTPLKSNPFFAVYAIWITFYWVQYVFYFILFCLITFEKLSQSFVKTIEPLLNAPLVFAVIWSAVHQWMKYILLIALIEFGTHIMALYKTIRK